jgi:hypothetical protein
MNQFLDKNAWIQKIESSSLKDDIKSFLIYNLDNTSNKDLNRTYPQSVLYSFVNNEEVFNTNFEYISLNLNRKIFELEKSFKYFHDANKFKNRDLSSEINDVKKKISKFIESWELVDQKIYNLISKVPVTYDHKDFDEWVSNHQGSNSNTSKSYRLYSNLVNKDNNYFDLLKEWNPKPKKSTYSRESKDTSQSLFNFIAKEIYLSIWDYKKKVKKNELTNTLTNIIIKEYNKLSNKDEYVDELDSSEISQLIRYIK